MAAAPAKPKKSDAFKVHTLYTVQGGSVSRKTGFCPKCGPGVFLAKHKNRLSCGKCGYSEFVKAEK